MLGEAIAGGLLAAIGAAMFFGGSALVRWILSSGERGRADDVDRTLATMRNAPHHASTNRQEMRAESKRGIPTWLGLLLFSLVPIGLVAVLVLFQSEDSANLTPPEVVAEIHGQQQGSSNRQPELSPPPGFVENALIDIASQANRRAPIMADSVTRVDRVSAHTSVPYSLTYYHTVLVPMPEEKANAQLVTMKAQMRDAYCRNMATLAKLGVSARWKYYSLDGKELATIEVAWTEC